MLWTRADLSFALVNNLELLTHYTKRAENERCFSRQNRDGKKTEMRKNIRVRRVFMPFLMDPDVCREPAHGARAARARGIS